MSGALTTSAQLVAGGRGPADAARAASLEGADRRAREALGVLLEDAEGRAREPDAKRRHAVAVAQVLGLGVGLYAEALGFGPAPAPPPCFSEAAIRDARGRVRAALGRGLDEGEVEQLGAVYEALMVDGAAKGGQVRAGVDERRRTGSHYTPRRLAEEVVRRTLAPLLADLGPDPSPAALLRLRVCDPAMGAGVFLLAACRELAAELCTAWGRRHELEAIARAHGDPRAHARSLVAARCLYGLDKDPTAVALARRSLWLTVGRGALPPSFADHALRHGDSLVGLGHAEVAAFHWAPSSADRPCRALLADDASTAERCLVADVCLGAFFAGRRPIDRERERRRRLDLVQTWLRLREEARRPGPEGARARAQRDLALAPLTALAAEARAALSPFHWELALPEVYGGSERARGDVGMSAVVANPPFLGGKRVSAELGSAYADYLAELHGCSKNADLSAHFLRRAARLLGEHGALGLITTNTIAQGHTRAAGLAPLLVQGFGIYDAVASAPWPGSAAVSVAIVHAARGRVRPRTRPRLEGREVEAIDSYLYPTRERRPAQALGANAGLAFVGSYVLGMGFTLSDAQREALVAEDPRSAERIFPYLGGKEQNTHPRQRSSRWIIDFQELGEAEARAYPALFRHVERHVRPARAHKDPTRYPRMVHQWWRYWNPRHELYAALRPLTRCLVTARVSKHLIFSFQPTGQVYSEQLCVVAMSSLTALAVLQSRVHEAWARLRSSSLEDRLRYSSSEAFETFPFPLRDPRAELGAVEEVGRRLYDARAALMAETGQGLTKTYNALKDPRVQTPRVLELRRLHERLDREVLAAYGWADLEPPPYGSTSEESVAYEAEVIERLYRLNAARADAEAT